MRITAVIMLLLLSVNTISAQNAPFKDEEPQTEEYTESRFRRGEIIFFLSTPFVLAMHALVIGGSLAVAGSSDNIPGAALIFGGLSVMTVSAGIIMHDQRSVYGSGNADVNEPEKVSYFQFNHRF